MPIDDPSVVDGIGTDRATGKVVLTISDHLDWQDERAHLQAMQNKLNAYLDFIQSGQISEAYPDASGAELRIDVIGKHVAPPTAGWFFQKIDDVARQSGVGFEYKPLPEGY